MTERLHFHFSLSCIGEGNGNPLQCSCLENPRDGASWWAAIYGVAQSRTWLKWFSSSSRTENKLSHYTFANRMSKLDNWKAFDLAIFALLFMTWHGWHLFFRIKLLHARKDGDDHWDFLVVSSESKWSELYKRSEFYMFFMGLRTYASILESPLLCGFLEHNFGFLFYSFSLKKMNLMELRVFI